MARVRPFRGVRYDPKKVRDITDVVAPPYDVISPELQDELYRRSPFNVVRLILGKELPGDDESENKYTRAARLWRRWLDEGILLREERPCLYVLRDVFSTPEGERVVRLGILAEVQLEPLGMGRVFPHERTFPRTKEDRLRLLRATKAQFNPIFAFYEESDGEVDGTIEAVQAEPPTVDFEEGGMRRTLWRITEGPRTRRISGLLADHPFFIADGHHRYETALAYREERQRAEEGGDGHEYVFVYLVNLEASGLVILPVHRIVRKAPVVGREALQRLGEAFELVPSGDLGRLREEVEQDGGFGLYEKGKLYRMKLRKRAEDALKDIPPLWREVPVAVLQALALEEALGITSEMVRSGEYLAFTPDAKEAVRAVDQGEARMAFLVPSTRIEHVRRVAEAGEVMPHKATYFYPKLPSGLVMREV